MGSRAAISGPAAPWLCEAATGCCAAPQPAVAVHQGRYVRPCLIHISHVNTSSQAKLTDKQWLDGRRLCFVSVPHIMPREYTGTQGSHTHRRISTRNGLMSYADALNGVESSSRDITEALRSLPHLKNLGLSDTQVTFGYPPATTPCYPHLFPISMA